MVGRKKLLGAFVAASVVALAAAPLAAQGAGAKGKGSTSATMNLIEVELSSLPVVGSVDAALGRIAAHATSEGTPESSVVVEAIRAAGQSYGSKKVSSKNGDESETVTLPLDAAGLQAFLSIAEMSATATPDSATAILSALGADVEIGPLGLGASVEENGIRSVSDGNMAVSTIGGSFGPVSIGLGDLLPAAVMGELPLSVVLDLVDELGIPLPDEIADQIDALMDMVDLVAVIDSVMAEIDAAYAELETLTASNPAVQAAFDAVADAEAQFDATQEAFATLQSQIDMAQAAVDQAIASMNAAQSNYDAVTNQLTAAQTELAMLQGQLAVCGGVPAVCDPIQAEIDELNTEIATLQANQAAEQTGLTEAQTAHADAVDDLAAVTSGLPGAQAAVDAAQAALDAAQAALDAALAAVSSVEIDALKATIDDLIGQVQDLVSILQDVLDDIGDLTSALDGILDLLDDAPIASINEITMRVSSSADAEKGVASVVCEASGIEVLGRPVSGGGCDALVGAFDDLTKAVKDVLKALPVPSSLPKVTFAGLQKSSDASSSPDADGVTSAVAGITGLHVKVPSVALTDLVDDVIAQAMGTLDDILANLPASVPVTGTLQDVIDQVEDQIAALPVGDTLSGLRTVGIDATVAGISTTSTFKSARAPEAQDPETNGGPGDTPDPRQPLPFTGSSVVSMIALALWLSVAGMVLTFVASRKREAGLMSIGK